MWLLLIRSFIINAHSLLSKIWIYFTIRCCLLSYQIGSKNPLQIVIIMKLFWRFCFTRDYLARQKFTNLYHKEAIIVYSKAKMLMGNKILYILYLMWWIHITFLTSSFLWIWQVFLPYALYAHVKYFNFICLL